MTEKLVASRADDTHPSIVKYAEITGIAGNSIAEIDLLIEHEQLDLIQSVLGQTVTQLREINEQGGYTLSELVNLFSGVLESKGFTPNYEHVKNAVMYVMAMHRVKICHVHGANFTDEDSYLFALSKELPELNHVLMLSVNTN